MSSALVQLQDTVRQFKASYEFEQASAKRSIDWNKFWAMAYRQAVQAQRRPRYPLSQFHEQRQQRQPSREQHSLLRPREAQEEFTVEAMENGVETYVTPRRQVEIGHTNQISSRRTLTPSSRHSQQSPQALSPIRAPRPLQSPSTQQKRVQFAPPEDYREQQIYRYEEADKEEYANEEHVSEQEEEEEEEEEEGADTASKIREAPLEQDDIRTDDIIFIDIELDDGSVATVGIAPEEDPRAVALEFVQEHQLAEHYVDLLAKYLHQTLSETTSIQVYDDPPERVPPPLVLSLEAVVLSWSQRPSLASIRSRHVIIVRLQNNQNFDWNKIVGARQTEMLAYQDVVASGGGRVGLGGGSGGATVEFRLMTSNTSLVLPHGRKPIVHLELWQISRHDMPNVVAAFSDPAVVLEVLQSVGSVLASATFVTNNDEYDGNGSAALQDRTGCVLGTLSFGVRRALMGSR